MYQALYRKWRPKTFSDVIGQQHITETLQRQVADGRLSHAYLFTGTRGTGKTTCAKILAKAANCEHPVNGDPCNCCEACRGIESGSFLDVVEMDAASNSRVDDIRALLEEVPYGPASVKRRVYIIDEVHMLSTSAFNALLKTLEEPPEHLMFILATTELHKVPATITSRCQRFSFKRILPEEIARRLSFVAQQEEIDLTADGAELLSRLADGALRDALSLLDQCLSLEGSIDAPAILELLGLAGHVQTCRLLRSILQRQQEAVLVQVNELYAGGKDVSAILGELSGLCRDLLIRRTAPQGGDALLSGGYPVGELDELLTLCDARRLLFLTEQLQKTGAELPFSRNRRTDAELCLMRLCDESLCLDPEAINARLARLENRAFTAAGVEQAAQPPAEQKGSASQNAPDDLPPWESSPQPVKEAAPLPREKERTKTPPAPSRAEEADGQADMESQDWPRIRELSNARLSVRKRVFLNQVQARWEQDALVLYCDSQLVADLLEKDEEVPTVLREAAAQVLGKPCALRFAVGKPGSEGKRAAPRRSTAAASEPTAPASGDKLRELIQFGQQFENFTVK